MVLPIEVLHLCCLEVWSEIFSPTPFFQMSSQQDNNQISPQDGVHLMCQELKKKHDDCFYKWYNGKFLNQSKDLIPCETEWAAYSTCTQVFLSIEMFMDQKKIELLQLADKVKVQPGKNTPSS